MGISEASPDIELLPAIELRQTAAKELRQLEEENAWLRKVLAEMQENRALKETTHEVEGWKRLNQLERDASNVELSK